MNKESWKRPTGAIVLATGIALGVSACSGSVSHISAETSAIASGSPSGPASHSGETTTPSSNSPSSESAPSATWTLTQSMIDGLESTESYTDDEVRTLEKNINILAAHPDLWKTVTSSNPRVSVNGLLAANKLAFELEDPSIADAVVLQDSNYEDQFPGAGEDSFYENNDVSIKNRIAARSATNPSQKQVGYSYTSVLANNPGHIFTLKTTPFGQQLASTPNQIIEDTSGNYYVGANQDIFINYADGHVQRGDYDCVYYLETLNVQASDGSTAVVTLVRNYYNQYSTSNYPSQAIPTS